MGSKDFQITTVLDTILGNALTFGVIKLNEYVVVDISYKWEFKKPE